MKLRFIIYILLLPLLISCNSSGGDSGIPNSAPTASSVTITDNNGGDVVVGDSLKGNYIYADEDSDSEGLSRYSWLRNGATIGGETASTYTLAPVDSGQSITFKVTPIAETGTEIGNAVTSDPIIVFNAAPIASSVTITDDNGGNVEISDTLTGSYVYNDIEGDIEGISTYRWLRNGVAIIGETSSTYTLVPADSSINIAFEVVPIAMSGTIAGDAVVSSSVKNEAYMISQNNFLLLTADIYPAVIDGTTGDFTKTDVELTVFIGDRNNQILTDEHTIYFVAEYGLIEPSCVTVDGSCSVTWSAIKRPDVGGPGSDGYVTIAAYATGEEAFTDSNGNNVFDDADAGFDDLEEPYVDANEDDVFSTGDIIIDVVSTNDPTGANGVHDTADGFYNGPGCTHSSLCGVSTSVAVFDMVTMFIINN